jgi:hypothetical protein
VSYPGDEGPGTGKRVVLVAGDEEYRSEEALPMLGKLLSQHHGFDCTVLFSTNPETGEIDPDEQTNIPGLEAVDEADVLVLFLRFRELPDEQMAHIVRHVEAGKPVIGIRTATHAFDYKRNPESPYAHWSWRNRDWKDGFGRQVLGETWVNHHGHHGVESTRGLVEAGMESHPILRGFTGVWGPTDVYGVRDLPEDASVLLRGQVLSGMTPDSPPVEGSKNEPMMPLVWTREIARGGEGGEEGATATPQRVVCSTIGASQDFASEGLRRVLVNSVYWCAGLEDAIPAESDVRTIGEYAPTPFGFGRATMGVRASDHALR